MNRKGSFAGIGKVYKFTLTQIFKNKANMITFGILMVIAAAAVPVISMFAGGSGADPATFETDYYLSMDSFLERDTVGFESRYFVQYGYSILVMIVCMFSCTYIVRAILEEKASKLVETLLVSVRSEAMILGKVFAVITFVVSMVAAVIACFGLSYGITSCFADTSFVGNTLANMGISTELLKMGPLVIIVLLVSVLLACILLSLISALSGAGCSNMEDMESANMTATMAILLCYMVTVFATPFGSGPALFMSLCPFLSAFAAPGYYITGDIGMGVMLLSWAIQILLILIIHRLSGRVYDGLIMYKGSRLKMRSIVAMMRGRDVVPPQGSGRKKSRKARRMKKGKEEK